MERFKNRPSDRAAQHARAYSSTENQTTRVTQLTNKPQGAPQSRRLEPTPNESSKKPIEPAPAAECDQGIFGRHLLTTRFGFVESEIPLDHGTFGAVPPVVRSRQRSLQINEDGSPGNFSRLNYPELLERSRSAVAELLGVGSSEVFFVPSVERTIDAICKSLIMPEGEGWGRRILYAGGDNRETIAKTERLLLNTSTKVTLPAGSNIMIRETGYLQYFERDLKETLDRGVRTVAAAVEMISTFPGQRHLWEILVEMCRDYNVVSILDASNAVGHIDLTHIGEVDPDFLVANCNRWLYSPRGSNILYMPKRNWNWKIPVMLGADTQFYQTQPSLEQESLFPKLFDGLSEVDRIAAICIKDAIDFRKAVGGGEQRIRRYCFWLAQEGGARMAKLLGTSVNWRSDQRKDYDQDTRDACLRAWTLTDMERRRMIDNDFNSFFANVKLPISAKKGIEESKKIADWVTEQSAVRYNTCIPAYYSDDPSGIYARISAQIYLDIEHFEKAAEILKELSLSVEHGEHMGALKPNVRTKPERSGHPVRPEQQQQLWAKGGMRW